MEINEGDELEFHYDNVNQKLICKVKKNFITLSKVKANIINFLVPCVLLCNERDEVEFIESVY